MMSYHSGKVWVCLHGGTRFKSCRMHITYILVFSFVALYLFNWDSIPFSRSVRIAIWHRNNRTCNYCKKPEHIKVDCRALKPEMKRLRELSTRVVGKRRSTTSTPQPKYSVTIPIYYPFKTQSNQKFYLRLKNWAHGSWIRLRPTMWPLIDLNFGNTRFDTLNTSR